MCPAVRRETVFHACFIISDNNPHGFVEFVHEKFKWFMCDASLFGFPLNFRALNFRAKAPNNGLKLALNFSPSHIRALEIKSELKCSKPFRAQKFRGEDPNRPLLSVI